MKKILVAIILILTGGLAFFLWQENEKEQEIIVQYEKQYEESLELNVQKRDIQQKIEDLEQDYKKNIQSTGTVQVLFTEMSSYVYELCYPIMESYGFTGILALSPTQFPGAEGCMSLEQFSDLIESGWTTCIAWQQGETVEAWLPSLLESLQQIEIEQGQTVYFPKNTYDRDLDESLRKYGFSIVVHHGEKGEILIPTEATEDIWRIGAVGLMGDRPKRRLNEALKVQGNIVFTVGFRLEEELYNERSFTSMLDYFEVYQNEKQLLVSNFIEAREHYVARKDIPETDESSKYLQEKATLEAELQAIEERLQELDALYG